MKWLLHFSIIPDDLVASELKDPIWHSLEWQIGSFSSEATICQFASLYYSYPLQLLNVN